MENDSNKTIEIVLNANSDHIPCEESNPSLLSTKRIETNREAEDYIILTKNMPFTIKAY